jgi:hypothetical protein
MRTGLRLADCWILLAFTSTQTAMSTSYRSLLAAVLIGIGLLTSSCTNPPQSLAGEGGFVEAYFDKATMTSLMSGPNCTHVRFYNARRLANDTKGTAIAIAVSVSATGAPIYNGSSLKYRMHDKITSATTPMSLLTDNLARTQIGYIPSTEKKIAAEFKKADIEFLLAAAGCTAIRVAPERLPSGYWTMRLHPAKLTGTTGSVNPTPPSLLDTEPCPTYCGTLPSNYIHL